MNIIKFIHASFLCSFCLLISCGDVDVNKKDQLVQKQTSTNSSTSQNQTSETKSSSKSQAVTLYFSGNLHGYLEPCGCAEGQLGGLKRRANLINATTGPRILIENGDLTSRQERLDEIKQDVILKSLKAMNYTVINLGERDLYLGLDRLKNSPVPIICANFTVNGTVFFPKTFEFSGPEGKIILIGLLGDSLTKEIKQIDPGYDLLSMREALIPLLADQPPENQVVLLLHGHKLEARELAKEFPQLKTIVYAHQYNMPANLSHYYPSGMYGKELGKITFKSKLPGEFNPVPLDDPNLENPKIQLLMNEYYQTLRKEKNLIRPITNKLTSSKYVGSQSCKSCHQKEYQKWESSHHFKAIPTLVEKKQEQNPSCLRCHTVGYGIPTGFVDPDSPLAVPQKLGAVGCESCHGPGERHLRNNKLKMKVTKQDCLTCHTQENSPKFDFNSYWLKIKH